jgi:diguanylate cyclase (GGDEF)-like protein/PAS domain S-box-containing protein
MADRAELVEAALDVYPEGLALLDYEERVVFWNRAAELITGYPRGEIVGRHLPEALEPLAGGRECEVHGEPRNGPQPGRGLLVHAQHKLGRDVPAIARWVLLRDGMGARMGTAAVFHPGEHLSALPHGETSDVEEVHQSQAELKDRLENEYEMLLHEGVPLAVLWIVVDQGRELRKTHGARACETMLESVERTLANGLKPGEDVGRWGDDEFLVLSHESSAAALEAHARVLAGLARTANFRWWGDRVSLTVSVGAALGDADESLVNLLERARSGMQESMQTGGNRVTLAPPQRPRPVAGDPDAPGRRPCSPS